MRKLELVRAAYTISKLELRSRYRRSAIGPWWNVLTTGFGVGGLAVVWAQVMDTDPETFVPTLALGLIVWQFISGLVLESPSVFSRNSATIKNFNTDYSLFYLQLFFRHLINLAHNFVVLAVIFIFYPPGPFQSALLAIPGFIMTCFGLAGICVAYSLISARFRDVEPLINSVWPIIFLLSPVIYSPAQLSINSAILYLNPFTYFISVIRDPILGVTPPPFVYLVASFLSVAGFFASAFLLNRFKKKLVYWV